MAQKRMFNKAITNDDNFLEMPMSSQVLYFHLSMNADDDGFVNNWKSIMRMIGAKEDDLKVLIAKNYIIPFDSGVIVIKHWRLNNYLQKDRIIPTQYQEELKQLKLDNNNVYEMYTKCIHSIEENSIDKNSIDKNSIDKYSTGETLFDYLQENGFTLTPIETQIVMEWEDNELTRYAIKQAVLNHAFRINYIEEILRRYKKDNIKTLQEAISRDEKRKDKNYKSKEALPEWFDKNIETTTNEKEEKEMEQLLNEMSDSE